MIRRLVLIVTLLLGPAIARADQIDVILKYPSKAAAVADLTDQTSNNQGAIDWLMDRAIPDLKVWRNSQDVTTTGTNPDGGGTFPIVTHTYLPGYFVAISLPRIVPALRDNAAVQVVIDRDTNTILRSTVGAPVLQDLRFSPVFAGSNYPFGNW